ncbi:class I SAM-dependent methyltransferase [Spirosoma soli]|uniref:Class I SAM-dependent methyltransferase n=1 Tax=Spirosoma soli TaxID=1770529 RepID=A0ABW5M8Y7_9BACT
MNAIEFHNAIATDFHNRYEVSKAFQERFEVWTRLFERYVAPTNRVMDMGCGSGVFSNYLAGKGCIVTGIDGSEAMINLCNQAKTVPTAQFVKQLLPLDNADSYQKQDVIIASSVLEYLNDMSAMLQQAQSLLKPGGLVMVSMPNKRSIYRRIERLAFQLTGYPRYFAHIRNVSSETLLSQQLHKLGFETLGVVYFSSGDPLSKSLKNVLPDYYVNSLFVGVYRKLKR